jgi:hypothetical protein
MTTIPQELAGDLHDFLTRLALSPQVASREAQGLLDRLEGCMETPSHGDLVRLAAQVTAIAPALAPPAIAKALAAVVTAAPPDPLAAFEDETARDLARYIMKRTGLVPVLTTSFDPGTKHREPATFNVLRFWMRDRDGMPVTRDLDLREYHPREGVKHALRAAARTAGLDHFGLPLVSKPAPEEAL